MKPKIIQIATAVALDVAGNESKSTFVVDDQGHAYVLQGSVSLGTAKWIRLPELPDVK